MIYPPEKLDYHARVVEIIATGIAMDDLAKAAIEAVREPSPEMLRAGAYTGTHFNTTEDIRGVWQAMVDEMLK